MRQKAAPLALTLSLVLAACSPSDSGLPLRSVVGTGDATLSLDLVRSSRGEAVPGSLVNLFRKGQHDVLVGQTQTDANGYAEFANIPAGEYDLTFSKASFAASAFNGAPVKAGKTTRLKVVQFVATDPNAATTPPSLTIQTPATLKDTGEVATYQPLAPDTVFTDKINVRAFTDSAAEPKLMRVILMSLVQLDATGQWSDLRPSTGVSMQDPGTITPGPDQQDTGLVTLDANGLSGRVYLQVVGLDFNQNRVAYLIPVTLNRSGALGTVTAPTAVQAVAYTLRERIDYLASVKPDAPTSGSNVWVTVNWTAPASLAGYQGFKVLRAQSAAGPYSQVAFAGEASCAAPAKNATTRTCRISDNTATLQSDQDYYYKVVALGNNEAGSNPAPTHILPAFSPALLAPASEARNVELLPVYTLKTNLPASATGFFMDLWVTDWLSGYDNAYSSGRLNFRRGLSAAGQSEFQGILNVSGTNKYVYRSSNAPADNFIQYDSATDTLGIPHQYEFGPALFNSRTTPLQAGRRYAWFLNKAYAYRLLDQNAPQSAANPIVAYSVYSDPTIPLAVSDGAQQQYTEIHEFTTRTSP